MRNYRLSEALLFCGDTPRFVAEFYGEEVVVYRLSLTEWIVYKPTENPCYELTILPDDDGGYGERYMILPEATTVPVKGWGVWKGDRFVEVYRPYDRDLTYEQVWLRLSPDDLSYFKQAQEVIQSCNLKRSY